VENTAAEIFAASGPDIRKQGDISRTLLANHGVLDMLTDDPLIETQHPIDHDAVVNADEREEVADCLKQLGYME